MYALKRFFREWTTLKVGLTEYMSRNPYTINITKPNIDLHKVDVGIKNCYQYEAKFSLYWLLYLSLTGIKFCILTIIVLMNINYGYKYSAQYTTVHILFE